VLESRNHWDEDYAWEQLAETCFQCAGKSADESLECLFDSVKQFSRYVDPRDDITAIVLKVPTRAVTEASALAPTIARLQASD
jgi:serine phosphatase RsbU (regulator of sigma subunit)